MKKFLVVLTLVVLFAPIDAQADTVRVDSMVKERYLQGHIDTGTVGPYPNILGNFYIGQIAIQWDREKGSGYELYTGYCVDLFSSFNLGNEWQVEEKHMTSLPIGTGKTGNSPYATAGSGAYAAWLANTAAPKNAQEGAALQLALWLTLYRDLKTDWFSFGNDDTTVKKLASDWFEAGLLGSADGVWLDADQNKYPHSQDFVVRTATPVPEPASMLLFGTGLIGLAGVARLRFRR